LCTISAVVCMDAELDGGLSQAEDRIILQSRASLPAGGQNQRQSRVDHLNELLHPLGLEMQLVVLRCVN